MKTFKEQVKYERKQWTISDELSSKGTLLSYTLHQEVFDRSITTVNWKIYTISEPEVERLVHCIFEQVFTDFGRLNLGMPLARHLALCVTRDQGIKLPSYGKGDMPRDFAKMLYTSAQNRMNKGKTFVSKLEIRTVDMNPAVKQLALMNLDDI